MRAVPLGHMKAAWLVAEMVESSADQKVDRRVVRWVESREPK